MRTSNRRNAAAVERWLQAHRSDLIHELIGLVNIRSVARYGEDGFPMGAGCKQALDYLQNLAQSYGFLTENDEDYCLSILMPGKSSEHELGIIGHLDVVAEGAGWKYAPFDACEKKGFVIGRGVIDNKGPLMMALYTLRAMRELGISLHNDVRLIAGCDEEQKMLDIQHFLQTHEPPVFTLNCDGAWPVCIGEKGILNADLVIKLENSPFLQLEAGEAPNMVPASGVAVLRSITPEKEKRLQTAFGDITIQKTCDSVTLRSFGKAAHCALPHTGTNALKQLLRVLCDLELFTDFDAPIVTRLLQAVSADDGSGLCIRYADAVSGSTTCTPTLLSLQGDTLRLHINVRYAVTQSADLLLQRLHARCSALGIALENIQISKPRYDSPSQPEIRLLLDTCREYLGGRFQPYVMSGGTYSRLFPRSVPFGVVTLNRPQNHPFGGPHAADEAINIDELLQAGKVYTAALLRLDDFFHAKHASEAAKGYPSLFLPKES